MKASRTVARRRLLATALVAAAALAAWLVIRAGLTGPAPPLSALVQAAGESAAEMAAEEGTEPALGDVAAPERAGIEDAQAGGEMALLTAAAAAGAADLALDVEVRSRLDLQPVVGCVVGLGLVQDLGEAVPGEEPEGRIVTPLAQITTNALGLGRFVALRPGDYEVTLQGRQWFAAPAEVRLDAAAERLLIRAAPSAIVTGRCVDSAGSGLPGAHVSSFRECGNLSYGGEAATLTDPQGYFRLHGFAVEQDCRYEIRASHPQFADHPGRGIEPQDGASIDAGELVFGQRLLGFAGLLMRPNGAPAKNVKITLHRPSSDEKVTGNQTDEAGRFALALPASGPNAFSAYDADAGRYELSAAPFCLDGVARRQVELRASEPGGGMQELGVLTVADGSFALAGRVVEAGGQAAPFAEIQFHQAELKADEEGRFVARVCGLEPFTISAAYRLPDARREALHGAAEVDPTAAAEILVVVRPTGVRFRLLDAGTGAAVDPGALFVSCQQPSGGKATLRMPDGAPEPRFHGAQKGVCRFTILVQGYQPWEKELEILVDPGVEELVVNVHLVRSKE